MKIYNPDVDIRKVLLYLNTFDIPYIVVRVMNEVVVVEEAKVLCRDCGQSGLVIPSSPHPTHWRTPPPPPLLYVPPPPLIEVTPHCQVLSEIPFAAEWRVRIESGLGEKGAGGRGGVSD